MKSVPFTPSYTHDVFLSFSGEDTRRGFTDHLYQTLVKEGIKTFIDDGLPRGEDIPQLILRAIEGSKLSLIVFSENYAASTWCLDEVVHILECSRSKNQMVLPIFYKVDSFDVRYQRGTYHKALAEHEGRINKDKVLRWREALSKAGQLLWKFKSGGEHENEFIDEIIKEISAKVEGPKKLHVAECPVGIDSRVQDMLEILEVGGSDVRMVGIWGIGGIGKTTIAKAVYNTIARQFEGICFLANVRKLSKQHGGLVKLQNALLPHTMKEKGVKIKNVDEGITLLRESLRDKRILLVVDGVNSLEQLKNLVGGTDWFGCGSRVIITTRDASILKHHQVNLEYEVPELNVQDALELFNFFAFEGDEHKANDFSELATAVMRIFKGIPFAMGLLGLYLFRKNKYEWRDEDEWRDELRDELRRRYERRDAWRDECGEWWDKWDEWKDVLESCTKHPKQGLEEIFERIQVASFLKTTNIGARHVSTINELLKKMPTELFQQKSANKLPRLHPVVRFAKAIVRHWSEPHGIPFKATELTAISFTFMSDLCRLSGIDLLRSDISRPVDGFTIFIILTSLNFESCQFLKSFPDASGLPNLRNLNLDCCTSLVKIDDSVGFLEKLVDLSLSGCHNLIMFPRRIALKSVESINFRGCRRLKSLPEIVGEMELLTWLDLSGTAIKEVPSTIGYLINLEKLILRDCQKLTNLSCCIYELQHLWCLDLQYCTRLVTLPSWNAESLPKKSSISPDLWYINLRGCKRLQEIPELPPKVQWVNAADCVQLGRFAKLSNILVRKESEMIKCLLLSNCQKLYDNLAHDVAKCGRLLLNEVSLCSLFLSCTQNEFEVLFPGNEVPRWFSRNKHFNLLETSEVFFEIPRSFKLGNKGLAICAAFAVETTTPKQEDFMQSNLGDCTFTAKIDINGESTVTRSFSFESKDVASAHVWLCYIPFIMLAYRHSPPLKCGVHVEHISQGSVRCKSYGVHLVTPQDEDGEA